MKRISKMVVIVAVAALLAMQTACTSSQIDAVIADLQVGVDAASVAAPLVLAAFAPAVAAPVTTYLAIANQVFAEIAKIAGGQATSAQKAAAIATAIAGLVAQDPSQILPPNSPPQLVAEVGAVANAAKAVASLFPLSGTAASARMMTQARTARVHLSRAQAARLAALQVQAESQVNWAALWARR